MSKFEPEQPAAACAEELSLARPSLAAQFDFERELERILRPYESPAANDYRCY